MKFTKLVEVKPSEIYTDRNAEASIQSLLTEAGGIITDFRYAGKDEWYIYTLHPYALTRCYGPKTKNPVFIVQKLPAQKPYWE